ncbi:MAG: NAD(P)-dependent oxidoreductase [Desulfovibrionaceae bacterium]|nr:NAD(P)-dependent oxidoreductase [Desulfovibrionaceae bacterium]
MKLVVTGAGGFLGQELAKSCQRQGVEVLGLDSAEGRDWVRADIVSDDLAEVMPEAPDAVVHLAALSRDQDCRDNAVQTFRVNVLGTLKVMEAARRRNAKQFIFASSEWVYDSFDPQTPKTEDAVIDIARLSSEYALSKLVGEANLRQQHGRGFCPVTVLRLGIIYAPRAANWSAVESLLHAVATKDEVSVGSLATGRQFIHVSDIVSAILASVGLEGFEILNVQGDRLITLGEIIDTAKRLTGKDPGVVELDPARPSVRFVSNEKIKRLLSWAPKVGLEQGLLSVKEFLGL